MANLEIFDNGTTEARAKRVRYIRDTLLGLTREEFCQDSPISLPALKAWELGWGGGLTRFGAKKLIDHLTKLGIYCTQTWLLYGIGRNASKWTKDLTTEENNEQILDEILTFCKQDNAVYTTVKDDAMLPLLNLGDYIGGIISTSVSTALNKEAIIVDEKNDIYIRKLENTSKPDHYNLVGLNPNAKLAKPTIENTNVELVAPIIWIRRC